MLRLPGWHRRNLPCGRRECALLRERSRRNRRSLTHVGAFDRPQTPTTQSHCWHLRHNGGWLRQRERARHSRFQLAARPRVCARACYGRCHTALVVCVLSSPSKSPLDGSLKPGPGALSLSKHTRVYAFCNLQVMPFPMIPNLVHNLKTLDPRVPGPNESGLVGYIDTKLV